MACQRPVGRYRSNEMKGGSSCKNSLATPYISVDGRSVLGSFLSTVRQCRVHRLSYVSRCTGAECQRQPSQQQCVLSLGNPCLQTVNARANKRFFCGRSVPGIQTTFALHGSIGATLDRISLLCRSILTVYTMMTVITVTTKTQQEPSNDRS